MLRATRLFGPVPLIVAAAIIAMSLRPIVPLDLRAVAALGAALLAATLLFRREWTVAGRAIVLFAGVNLVLAYVLAGFFGWPWHLLLPLVATAIVLAMRGELILPALGISTGAFSVLEVLWIAGIGIVAGSALWLWTVLLRPDLADFQAMIPAHSAFAIAVSALGFALLNAAMEEIAWRGMIQHWLTVQFGKWFAVVLQAASFGAIHWAGFPSGWIGIGLATVYGLMLGALRVWSGGLLAPLAAHILADLVIFALVLSAT
jgi:membrane protease YdiL (CAAX protease family)